MAKKNGRGARPAKATSEHVRFVDGTLYQVWDDGSYRRVSVKPCGRDRRINRREQLARVA
jgi:hypothetical protein